MRLAVERIALVAVLAGTAATLPNLVVLRADVTAPESRPARFEPRWDLPAPPSRLEDIRGRGRDVTASVEMTFEPRLIVHAQQVDFEAVANAPAVARRLAREFALSPRDVAAAQASCGSWGELTLALTLRSAVEVAITPGQIAALHREGVGWTRIAHGLGLDIDSFVSAAEAGTDVAAGWVEPDGRLPEIGGADAGNTGMRLDE